MSNMCHTAASGERMCCCIVSSYIIYGVNIFISPRVRKRGFTHAKRAEIRIFTPRDIKFRIVMYYCMLNCKLLCVRLVLYHFICYHLIRYHLICYI